jgi:spermidine synthase
MGKSRSFFQIFIPSITIFFSSFCIMVLELIAARLTAKYLGSSLYTWTSVIGVVLAGITIGNYLGGRIADQHDARKALAVLFLISSAACVLTVIFSNLVGGLIWLWRLDWPVRVFSHVLLVFFIPSMLLGMISPIVAKMALDQGLPTGRTVGDIYAWGAAGSIAGTFIAGYYLIVAMGTIAIIWTVGVGLLLTAILYRTRLWVSYVWAILFIVLMIMAIAPVEWAKRSGAAVGLREKPDPNIIYEDESAYCYIAVKQLSEDPDIRQFVQDKLDHSIITMNNIRELRYCYEKIYAAVTHRLSEGRNKLSVFGIGGGGYVFPRYIRDVWSDSRVDVAEIDTGVTKAAMAAFGLEKDTTINIFTMDARNYVDELLRQMRSGQQTRRYDFIYGDAFNDYSVPYQLVTKEFNDKIAQLLTDDGTYMINVIDIYNSGLFLGACVNTLKETFPHVDVVTENKPRSERNTFVIIASKKDLNLERLDLEEPAKGSDLWKLNDSDIEILREKSHRIVLTDDYAPVENMLAPVVQQSTVSFLLEKSQEKPK